MKKYFNLFLSVALVFSLLVASVPSSHADFGDAAEYYVSNFWDMITFNDFDYGLRFWNNIIGYTVGQECPSSPDKYHHGTYGSSNFAPDGKDDTGAYSLLTCNYCNKEFKAYRNRGGGFSGKSDFEKSYDSQVAEMPNKIVTSGTSLQGYPLYGMSKVSSLSDVLRAQSEYHNSSSGNYFYYPDSHHLIEVSLDGNPAQPMAGSFGFYFQVPYSGNYYISWPENVYSGQSDSIYKWGNSTSSNRYSNVKYPSSSYLGPAVSSSSIYFDSSTVYAFNAYTSLYGSGPFTVDVHFDLIPDENYFHGPIYSASDIDSRPASIAGDYGIIGDNGKVTKIEGNTIVNETNNSVYNPVTGETHNMSDWSYNYVDRSYTVTTTTGDTITITYGDENIIIKEGDTTYNVYYIIQGSGSGENPDPGPGTDPDPDPDPDPGDCNHHWTESSYTPPTCTVPGSRLLTCTLCSEVKTETIPATGHDWVVKQTVTTEYDDEGNLIQEGYTIFECTICGEQYKTTDGGTPPSSGPSFGESNGIFSGIFGLLLDFLSFFWNVFRAFVGEGVKGFLEALMDGTSFIFGLLNPFEWWS